MADCIFCKIINGELPTVKVYEDTEFLAILDLNPTAPGHTLIFPKNHFKSLIASPDEVLSTVLPKARIIAQAVMAATDSQGFNLVVNNGRVANQLIEHFHIHIIPRNENDGLTPWPQGEYETGEREKLGEKIRKELD